MRGRVRPDSKEDSTGQRPSRTPGCREGGLQIHGWQACSAVGASGFHRACGPGGRSTGNRVLGQFPTAKHSAKQLPLLPRMEGSSWHLELQTPSFPSIPSEPRMKLLAWQSLMPTVGVFSDSSRFKFPLDTAAGSYEPFVIFPFADGDLEAPESQGARGTRIFTHVLVSSKADRACG